MIPNGTYAAKLRGTAIIYLAGKDEDNLPQRALMGFLPMTITEGEQSGQNIDAQVCFIAKDGSIMTRTIETMQEVFSMEGANPYWMQFLNPDDAKDQRERDLTGIAISIVVEAEEYNGKTSAKVKWINKPGGSGWTPKTADRGSILAKYGSQFRALSGGAPMPSRTSSPTKPNKPATAPAPKKPVPPVNPNAPTATMEQTWAEFIKVHDGKSDDDLTALWYETLRQNFQTDNNSDITPQQWGQLLEKLTDNVPA